jgi:hypothetical protein
MRFFQSITRDVTGTHLFKTWPFRFTDNDTTHKRVPPLLGEHNCELLDELLGISPIDCDRLAAEGVIGAESAVLAI